MRYYRFIERARFGTTLAARGGYSTFSVGEIGGVAGEYTTHMVRPDRNVLLNVPVTFSFVETE